MNNNGKSLENWIWDTACSIRGAKDTKAVSNKEGATKGTKKGATAKAA